MATKYGPPTERQENTDAKDNYCWSMNQDKWLELLSITEEKNNMKRVVNIIPENIPNNASNKEDREE